MQESGADTILGSDIVFRGKLNFKNRLQINGKFKGQISTGGHLIIGSSAEVEADISAETVTIQGKLRGNINASRRIDLLKNANLRGDMKTPDLQVESGARFSGSCIMEDSQ